jgi:hypothetical protein
MAEFEWSKSCGKTRRIDAGTNHVFTQRSISSKLWARVGFGGQEDQGRCYRGMCILNNWLNEPLEEKIFATK